MYVHVEQGTNASHAKGPHGVCKSTTSIGLCPLHVWHAWGEIWQVWGKYHVLEVRGTFPCIIRYFLLMYP